MFYGHIEKLFPTYANSGSGSHQGLIAYKNNRRRFSGGDIFAIRPMNCPSGMNCSFRRMNWLRHDLPDGMNCA